MRDYWYPHEAHERTEAQDRPQRAPAVLPACAPGLWAKMQYYLAGRGLDFFLAERNGWYPSDSAGDREPRIVMPGIRSDGGVFWQARAMLPSDKRYQSPHANRADALIVVKPNNPHPKYAALVEGPMDALAAADVGMLGISMMGNTPNVIVLDHIAVHVEPCKWVYVVPDADSLPNAVKLTAWLTTHAHAKTLLRSTYPYKDLAAIPRKERKEMFEA